MKNDVLRPRYFRDLVEAEKYYWVGYDDGEGGWHWPDQWQELPADFAEEVHSIRQAGGKVPGGYPAESQYSPELLARQQAAIAAWEAVHGPLPTQGIAL